jgi:hypothetical protein
MRGNMPSVCQPEAALIGLSVLVAPQLAAAAPQTSPLPPDGDQEPQQPRPPTLDARPLRRPPDDHAANRDGGRVGRTGAVGLGELEYAGDDYKAGQANEAVKHGLL